MSSDSNAAKEAPKEAQSYTDWVKSGYSKLPGFSHSSAEPSEDQKKQLYHSLPHEQKEKQTYTKWVKSGYNNQYERWMPWIEDQYLAWFGKDNKASYATKGTYPISHSAYHALMHYVRHPRQDKGHRHRPSRQAPRRCEQPSW